MSSLDKKKELSIKNRISIDRSIDRFDRSLDYVSGRRRRSRRGERFSFSLSLSLSLCVCVCVCARVIDRRIFYSIFGERKKERADICCLEIEKPKEEIVEK